MIPSRTGLKRYFYNFKDTSFAISELLNGKEATVANGATIEEPPGVREYDDYSFYLAYLRDPTGHKLCGLMRVK